MNKFLAFSALLITSMNVFAEFEGEVKLTPIDCEKVEKCFTLESIKFTDPNGLVWYAEAGTETDGATIPKVIEKPVKILVQRFEPEIMKAVVLHDHYCRRHVRSWYQTNRMFYDALLASKVDVVKAKLMFGAVLVGSNVWIKKIKGQPCNGYKENVCVKSFGAISIETLHVANKLEPNSIEFINDYIELDQTISSNPDISLEEIEKKAAELRPDILNSAQNIEDFVGNQSIYE